MENPGERMARAEARGRGRPQRERVQTLIGMGSLLRKFMAIQHDLEASLLAHKDIIDSTFLSDLKTILVFVFNNKITSVQKMV